MEIEVTPHVNVIILLASAADSYNQPQLTDRNALSGTVWSHCSAVELWETLMQLKRRHLKQNDTWFHCAYPLHRKSLWAMMIAILLCNNTLSNSAIKKFNIPRTLFEGRYEGFRGD